MHAAVFHGDKRITIGSVELPQPLAGEVLLRVNRTALCGSDIKLWIKGGKFTPGHEIFGTIEQPGHALHGRRCLVYIPVHCGHCASCLAGDTQMFRQRVFMSCHGGMKVSVIALPCWGGSGWPGRSCLAPEPKAALHLLTADRAVASRDEPKREKAVRRARLPSARLPSRADPDDRFGPVVL